jgi:hypothetical protein
VKLSDNAKGLLIFIVVLVSCWTFLSVITDNAR